MVNMMNTAIRHGTTRWIEPGEQQKINWRENSIGKNNEQADLANFRTLVDNVIEQVDTAIPEAKEVCYDFDRKGFYDSRTQEPVPAEVLQNAAESRAARAAKIGSGTIRQAIILKSILQGEYDRGRSSGTLQALLDGNNLLYGAERTCYQDVEGRRRTNSGAQEEPRGSYEPTSRTISLLKNADLSTFQ